METILSVFSAIVLTISSWFGGAPQVNTESVVQSETPAAVATASAGNGSATAVSTPKPTATSDASSSALPKGSAWLSTVPLGDGKYTTNGPKKGNIYLCNVMSGGGGAMKDGPWIHGSTWNPGEKVKVQGAVSWPEASYKMSIKNGTRTITTNNLPTDHTTGVFPIAASDPAYQYDRNPSAVAAKNYTFALPAYPTPLSKPGCIYGEVGIMNNGVLLFDGFDALNRDAIAHELQDTHDGHPNTSGYHKHGFITDIKNVGVSTVVGFAFDGYPITGPKLPNGNYLTTNDLDECHGMESTIMLDGKEQKSYHYVLTQDFPYSVSCFKGTLKVTPQQLMGQNGGTTGGSGMQEPGGPMGGQQGGTPPAPPQEAITACSGKASGASCTVGGQMQGTCATIGTSFACRPNNQPPQ